MKAHIHGQPKNLFASWSATAAALVIVKPPKPPSMNIWIKRSVIHVQSNPNHDEREREREREHVYLHVIACKISLKKGEETK